MKNYIPGKIISILLLFVFLCPLIVPAQSVWYGREEKNSIYLEFNKPFTPSFYFGPYEIPGLDPISGSTFLSGKYSLKNNKNITFIADIPVAHGYVDDTLNKNGSEWMFGNPYIGAEFDIPKTPVYFELGLRLPFAPDDQGLAEYAGSVSDFDRSEAFLSYVFPIYSSANYYTVTENKILISLRGGINVWFKDDTASVQSDPSVRFDYHLQTGYMDKNLEVILSAVGRKFLSSNAKIIGKSNVIQYGFSVVVPYKKIRPGLSFRFPGDSTVDHLLNFVVGLNFGYVF